MVAIATLLCFIAFLAVDSEGRRFRTPCSSSASIRCDDGGCIYKNNWCDRGQHCYDNSDEKYCQSRPGDNSCNNDIHFKCDSGMCIPAEGHCDGYSNCPDQSDEKNCPCEGLNDREGNFQYEAFIDTYQTQYKCWKISLNEAQFLELRISATLRDRNCMLGNVTIHSDDSMKDNNINRNYKDLDNIDTIICPSTNSQDKTFTYYKDIYIRYQSNYYDHYTRNYKDLISITFRKTDTMCKRPDAFKCSQYSCISPEKECDRIQDCENGKDEINCDNDAYLRTSRTKAVKWIRNQHNSDWSWKENTHRAVIALSLAGDTNFNSTSQNDDLIAKQLELELFTYLLRYEYGNVPPTILALYINALLAICHNPRNFYGHDLIFALKGELDSSFPPPLLHLTLCNAKEPLSEDEMKHMLEILDTSSPNNGFFLELQALTTLALTCFKNNGIKKLEHSITDSLKYMKSMQKEDGSFGKDSTTALVLQALIANNQEHSTGWNYESSIQFLLKKQKADGSFGDFLTTYLVTPVLYRKTLLDIGKINCTNNRTPKDDKELPDIQNPPGKKIAIKYSLFIGDELDQIHPMMLKTPENITVLELMTLAADIDPKYKFKLYETKKKKFIDEISNIANDAEINRFWFIYHGIKEDPIPFSEQSPDKIKAHEKDHIIMWYKTLDSLD